MDKRQIVKMFFSVIMPPVMVITLFIAAIGAVIIPATEDALMEKKRDTIQAIVTSATSILENMPKCNRMGLSALKQAKRMLITPNFFSTLEVL